MVITYHDSLHGLHIVQDTGTAILKDKLLHQVTYMKGAFIHTMFLGILKEYDALCRDR